MAARNIQDVLEEESGRLMSLAGVVGTALGLRDGVPCITVFVEKRGGELERLIPPKVEGYAVVLEETGKISAL